MPNQVRHNDGYHTWIGLAFVFNLIVGTGALTLPSVFANAGWALGLAIIVTLGFISYMTVTFVIEAMSCANAVMHWRRLQLVKQEDQTDEIDSDTFEAILPHRRSRSNEMTASIEHTPLFSQISSYYDLDSKIELGEMAGLFFNSFGRVLFVLCIAIYLYGDLSIYSAAIGKSLRDVIWYDIV